MENLRFWKESGTAAVKQQESTVNLGEHFHYDLFDD